MNGLIEKWIFLLNLNRTLLHLILKEMKTYGAIILIWPLSVQLFADFHLEKKKKKHTHDSLTLMLSTFSCCSLFRNHVSLVSYSSSLSLSLSRLHSFPLSFFLFYINAAPLKIVNVERCRRPCHHHWCRSI